MNTKLSILLLSFFALSTTGCALFTPMTPQQTADRQALIAANSAPKTRSNARNAKRAAKNGEKKLQAYWDYSKGKQSAKAGTFGRRGCRLKVCRGKK